MKKKQNDSEIDPLAGQVPPVLQETASVAALSRNDVVVTTWAGMPLYCCTLCAFDTLKENEIAEHIAIAHGQQTLVNPSPAPQLDPSTASEKTTLSAQDELEGKADETFEFEIKENEQ